MIMDCIFCKIIENGIPSVRVWENEKYLAILDINPNTRGLTLVMPKKHFDSDVFKIPFEELKDFLAAAKEAGEFLKRGLAVERVAIVVEGTGVNHAHVKLYPMYKGDRGLTEAEETVYFNVYPGYISTQLGPRADLEELKKLAEEIKKKN